MSNKLSDDYDIELRNAIISLDGWVKVKDIAEEHIIKLETFMKGISKKYNKDLSKEVKKYKDIMEIVI